jgi:hypothetical protein
LRLRPYCAKHGQGLSIHLLDSFRIPAQERFHEKKLKSGYSYWRGEKRVFKLATHKENFFVEFNFTIPPTEVLLLLSDEDARLLGTGRVRQCYVGSDVRRAEEIIKQA